MRYEVTETFTNHGPRLEEADYLFPLPAGAAFQDLKLSINGEMVAGEALSAGEARSVYEEIVRRQRDPALVEWMGTGLLRARIFPIAPGEEKKVVVRFQTVAQREGDALRIDYVGAGRPGRASGMAWASPANNFHAGSSGVAREDSYPSSTWSGFVLSYTGDEAFGTPYSPTHSLVLDRDGSRRIVRIDGDARDVTILLPLTRRTSAAVTMLPYAPGDGPGFALITLAPPTVSAHPTPRDITFVLDVSGSMAGRKLEQARAAGRQLLATLTPQDRFRLIDFSTDVRTFRDEFERATPEHLRDAQKYLDELDADGSTNIEAALARALTLPLAETGGEASEGQRFPLTLFITDGEPTVGERDAGALVRQAVARLGHTRLFTFGLGSDVNTSLIEQLALQGHGTSQFVRPDESVERAVSLVAQRLTDPVITDVTIHTDGVRLRQILPSEQTDLFAGQDLVLLARYEGSGRTALRFTGRTPEGPVSWETSVDFPERERANPFVARLWATQKIGYLEAERHRGGATPELDAELKELGDRFGIPTELTSYLVREPMVAVGNPQPTPTSVSVAGGVARDEASNALKEFRQAKTAAAQRSAISLSAADSVGMAGVARDAMEPDARAVNGGLRHAGDATFVWRDSVWTDTRYQSSAGVRVIRVRPFSDAYFAVLQLAPALHQMLSVGERVLVMGHGVAIEISPVGVTTLADADVTAIRAGW